MNAAINKDKICEISQIDKSEFPKVVTWFKKYAMDNTNTKGKKE
jgi:hypothetical protein